MSQTGNGAINRILNSITIFGFSHLNEHGLVILKMHALQTEWKAKANQALPKKTAPDHVPASVNHSCALDNTACSAGLIWTSNTTSKDQIYSKNQKMSGTGEHEELVP